MRELARLSCSSRDVSGQLFPDPPPVLLSGRPLLVTLETIYTRRNQCLVYRNSIRELRPKYCKLLVLRPRSSNSMPTRG